MSFPALRASGRAAYRDLLRASSQTFAGDNVVRDAFRDKMRGQAMQLRSQTSPSAYEESIKLAREIAQMLRRNVVQAVKVEDETWRVQITKDTEIGDNESIKTPCESTPMSERKSRREAKAAANRTDAPEPSSTSTPPMYYSSLKKAHKDRKLPELNEDDLEETFVRGSGPGGQSINKTENNVQLIHKPTGIRVTCQQTRSLQTNRMFARRILLEKLDRIQNPGLSKGELQRAKQRERERRRRKKAKKKDKAGG